MFAIISLLVKEGGCFYMKHSNFVKRSLALFAAIMCLTSMMSLSFANGAVGWPSGGSTTSSNDNNTDVIGPTVEQQEVIDYKTWGESDISATINKNTTSDAAGDQLASNIYAQYSDTLPDVSIDDLVEWSNRKGFEIIKFLQTFIQPFAIIIFMISAIMVLVGSIGNSQISGKGFMGLLMSVLVYAGVLYSPSILSTLVAWLGS